MIRTLHLSLVIVLLTAVSAMASINGKVGRTALSSTGCGSCHASTASSSVALSVPGSTGNTMNVTAGASVNLSVLIAHTSTGRVAGVNIAVKTDMNGTTDAGTLTAGAGLKIMTSGTAKELTHTSPKALANNAAQFDFTWTAPTTPGTYYLRAVGLSANNDGVESSADLWNRLAQFTLVVAATTPTPTITVTAPNGGESFLAGSVQNITWTSSNVTNVAIDWSATGSTGPWTTIVSSVAAATSTYAWTVPATATTNGFIRVRDAGSSTTSDVSNAAWSIATAPPPASLTLLTPIGGATMRIGSVVPITWKSTSVATVDLDFSTTGPGGPWKRIATGLAATPASYAWTVPADSSTNVVVRIQSSTNPTVSSQTTLLLSILPPSNMTFALALPAGGEIYHVGDVISIQWEGTAVGVVTGDDDGSDDEGDDDGDDGGGGSTDTTGTGGGSTDTTGAGGGSTDTTSTGGGSTDTTSTGTGTDTTSTSGGADTTKASKMTLRIEWSADGPAGPWTVIAEGVPVQQKQYRWIAPDRLTTTAYVRLSDMLHPTATSVNAHPFSIVGRTSDGGDSAEVESVHITAPHAGDVINAGGEKTVTWVTRATRLVHVQWDACGDGWKNIASSIHADRGSFQWHVPTHADGIAVIRIVDAAQPTRILEVSGAFYVKNPIVADVRTTDEHGRALIAPQPVGADRIAMLRKPQADVDHCEIYAVTGQIVQNIRLDDEQTSAMLTMPAGAYLIRWFTPSQALSFTSTVIVP